MPECVRQFALTCSLPLEPIVHPVANPAESDLTPKLLVSERMSFPPQNNFP